MYKIISIQDFCSSIFDVYRKQKELTAKDAELAAREADLVAKKEALDLWEKELLEKDLLEKDLSLERFRVAFMVPYILDMSKYYYNGDRLEYIKNILVSELYSFLYDNYFDFNLPSSTENERLVPCMVDFICTLDLDELGFIKAFIRDMKDRYIPKLNI